MVYNKKSEHDVKYQGESFSRIIDKADGSIWEASEGAVFSVYDTYEEVVLSGVLVKSGDNLTLTVTIGKTDTLELLGLYRIVVYRTDTGNTEINDSLYECKLNYIKKKATSTLR